MLSMMVGAALSLTAALSEPQTAEHCTSQGMTKAKWQQVKQEQFSAIAASDTLLAQLLSCLAHPDPVLRDEIGYAGFVQLLRAELLTTEEVMNLYTILTHDLKVNKPDEHNVYLPFAALVLSEVMRVDRLKPYLNDEQRQSVLDIIASYLGKVTDYRGFDEQHGWRHSVAHSADVLLQMALNAQLTTAQRKQLADIAAAALTPNVHHFYVFDEPGRLARAVAYDMLNPKIEVEYWQQWLVNNSLPQGFNSWQDIFGSEDGLAQRHNRKAFYQALYSLIGASEKPRLQAITPTIVEVLRSIP